MSDMNPFDFIQFRPQATGQNRPAAPLSLNLIFSNDCESSCVYCCAKHRTIAPSQHLPTRRWIEIFRQAHAAGVKQVSFSGGDPLFREDALTLIGELIRLEMRFQLSTKCHITRTVADGLVQVGMTVPLDRYIREIQISVDGPDAATADHLAGRPGYFHQSVDSIKNLVGRGFNVRVRSVVTHHNAHRVYHLIKLALDLGVNQVTIAAYNSTYRHDDALSLSQQERVSIAEQCSRAKMNFPNLDLKLRGLFSEQDAEVAAAMGTGFEGMTKTGRQLRDRAADWTDPVGCARVRSSMTITPDGKVVLCGIIPQKGMFVVGDVTNQTLMEIWDGRELLDCASHRREEVAGPACHDRLTDDRQDKQGYCFLDGHPDFDSSAAPPPICPLAPDDGSWD